MPYASFSTHDCDCSPQGEAASITALEAIQSVATQLGSSLALWGTYISEFVADVAGDNELTDEETAALEKHR